MRWKIYPLFILFAVLAAGLPATRVSAADARCQINLVNNTHTCGGLPGVTFVAPPAGGRALMRINRACYSGAARFIITYNAAPSGWTVNIGDSVSNDGWGGDIGTQSNDAELQILNQEFSVYGSQNGGNQLLQTIPGFAQNGSVVSFDVRNNGLDYNGSNGISGTLNSSYLYALAGQADTEGLVNYDIYAAFNRVINGTYRVGTGVSQVIVLLGTQLCQTPAVREPA